MVRFPAGGYCCSKECLLVVVACVGGVLGGGHRPYRKTIGNKKRYVRRERDLPKKEEVGRP